MAEEEIKPVQKPEGAEAPKAEAPKRTPRTRRTEGPRQSGRKFQPRGREFVPRKARVHPKKERKIPPLKLFGRWDSNVELQEPGLKNYINLEPRYLPRSAGVHRNTFHKSRMHIVERLALHLLVPGHQGKKHRLTSGKLAGNFNNTLGIVEKALEIIEKKENKNPVEFLVRAIENSALREEIISYQLGSIMAREAVVTAPQRRIDKTLRAMSQGSYRASFNKKLSIEQALANEILAAARGSTDSFAMREKERVEREAQSSR